ncbi:MAG TPA: hypothetical protein VFM53_08685 [Anaeromyxobacteraceae bacterium]|nr:hypothetical protein [Anaeromyxobacteraceae bacterium]
MSPNEVVVAGSSEFVDALLPLVNERFGEAPRVADSPHLASALCQGGARVLVYEHGGPEWLVLCSALGELAGPDLVAVAALPPEHAADVARISAAASAVVAWRGDPRPVLDAVNRVLAAREAPPAHGARRLAVTAAARPAPAPAAPRAVATPGAARPAVTPTVGRPALTPTAYRPAVTPTGPRPAVTPTAPRAARAAPTPEPSDSATLASPPVDVAVAVEPARPPPAAGGAGESFEGLFDESVAADLTPVPIAASAPAGAMPPPSATWPANVLSADDGLSVVRAALSGLWPEARLRPVTEAVVASLSTAEKAAALGQNLPFDAAPVRRAVGLRWQVASALDSLPPTGSPVDQHAVQAILLGIDEVLAALKEQGDDAGPESLRAVESVRHALVKEAIDLTEALQGIAGAEVVEEITTSRKARRGETAPVTRMVTPPRPVAEERRSAPWGLVAVLVLAVAGAAAYHGWRYVNRPGPAASPIAGAPAGSLGSVAPRGKVVVLPPGTAADPREIERFKELERAKGNDVREIAPGKFIVSPREAGGKP